MVFEGYNYIHQKSPMDRLKLKLQLHHPVRFPTIKPPNTLKLSGWFHLHLNPLSGTLALSFQPADFNECLLEHTAGVMVQPAAPWTPNRLSNHHGFAGVELLNFAGWFENFQGLSCFTRIICIWSFFFPWKSWRIFWIYFCLVLGGESFERPRWHAQVR